MKPLLLQLWYSSPFHYWGWDGLIWQNYTEWENGVLPQQGCIRAPLGGMLEAIFRRRRRCMVCEKFFWRRGAFNPFIGVNIFEECCSRECNDIDLSYLPY